MSYLSGRGWTSSDPWCGLSSGCSLLTGQVPVSGLSEAAATGYAHGGADAEATQDYDVSEQVRN